ncbi:MAG: DNA translocase FtsK [Candidatus Shapirobacteria bacterium]|nr:DNA translocase FtsK [Candidatus Shapirobacteria bacterium]MDD3002369.1 DNA translocase FtsK [Candidatus Shapirobacteria bacterium]MDD4383323.1 DNA translocase FtsK [Candidatus Shapirobacteria bacterium]
MAKRGRKKKHALPVLRLKQETIKTIFFIFFLVLSIISLFSFLQTGPYSITLNLKLVEWFGLISVFVPFLLLLISFLFTKMKVPLKEANVFFGTLIMFVSLLGLLRQGSVGTFFGDQIASLWGELPRFFIFFFSGIAGFVILFDTNVNQIVKFFVKLFKAIKKYTVGNGKEKESKSEKKSGLFLSELSPFKSNKKNEEPKEDPNVINIPPVIKPQDQQLLLQGSPLQSLSNNQIWEYPSISIFDGTPGAKADRGDVRKNASIIEETLESFGIRAKVVEYNNSPSVTQYALEVALGTKLAKIISLSNDLAMALSAPGGQIRIEAPIPGRALVGIEVPNKSLEVVPIRKVIESDAMKNAKTKITVPLGLDVAGNPKVADIAKMPHVLIAGQTNSGKSVCVNSWISNILFRASPQEVRMIMVDPKRVELTPYNGIPHLLTPVIVDPEKVISALKWAVDEMQRRYKTFTEVGAKNIESYNNLSGFQSMPYILIFIDELADIMLFSPSEVEDNICRLAQMSRAVGIHLILATQRPSVNVITGLIKANIPTRISFAVTSVTDSRVVLDTPGAEKLLGRGDMLYGPQDLAKPVRIQGCFVSDKEINTLVDFLKSQKTAEYDDQVVSQPVSAGNGKSVITPSTDGGPHDPLYDSAVKLIQDTGKASTTFLQRKLSVGYARAAKILDEIEGAGLIGPSNGAKPRDILMPHAQGDSSAE